MKKILSVILVLAMLCMTMISCGNVGLGGQGTTDGDTTTAEPDEKTDPDEDTSDPDEDTTDPDEDITDPDEDITDPDDGEKDPDKKPLDEEAAENLKNNALAMFAEGLDKTLTSFYDVANVSGTLCGMEKGAAHITVNNSMLTEETGVGKITESVFFDMTDGKFGAIASDTTVAYGEELYKAFLYVTQDNAYASGNAIFGDDSKYMLDIANLVENFLKSELKASLEAEEGVEAVEEFIDGMEMALEAWNARISSLAYDAEFSAEMLAWTESLLLNLDPVVVVETVNGEDALKITYTVNNENVGKLLEALFTTIPDSYIEKMLEVNNTIGAEEITVEDVKGMISEEYPEILAQYEALPVDFNLSVSFALAGDDGALLNVSAAANVDTTITEDETEYKWTLDPTVSITFGDDAIVLDVEFEYTQDGKAVSGKLVSTTARTEEGGVVSFRSDLDVSATNMSGEKIVKNDLIVLEAKYVKKTGDWRIDITVEVESYIYDEETGESTPTIEYVTAGARGTLKVQDGAVTLTVDSVKADDFELNELGVTLVIDTQAEMPTVPADAKELMSMTEEELMALMEAVMDSPFGQLISSMQGSGSAEPAMMQGKYVNYEGIYYIFEEGYFEFGRDEDVSLSGYYWIEDGGETLVLEYWNDSTEEWNYNYLSLKMGGDVLVINSLEYYYDYSYGAPDENSLLYGEYVNDEGVFAYFDGYDYFAFYTDDETLMSGYYEVYTDYDDEGYETIYLYLEWWDEDEEIMYSDLVIEFGDDMVIIGEIAYYAVVEEETLPVVDSSEDPWMVDPGEWTQAPEEVLEPVEPFFAA